MLKRLIIPFILIPCLSFAQFTDDFEDADISNWTESTTGRWAASDDSPLNGSYSLHHIFDNSVGDHDQVSVPFPNIELTSQSVTWRFKIRHKFDPSSANYWGVYLLSNVDANQMFPSGSVVDQAYGYIIGVNFTGTDDTLRLWKMELGSVVQLMSTTINWQNDITTSGIPAIEVIRKTDGTWIVNFDKDGDFNNLNNVGSINDLSYTNADYFGVYYEYTSSRDQAIWIDDIYIGPEIVDVIPPTVDSLFVVSSHKLKIEYSEMVDSAIAVTNLNYTLNGGIGNPDSIAVDVLHKYAELFFDQKFADNQQYDITIQNIEDEEGNVIKDTTLNFTYEYIKPLSVEVISINEIEVQFSRKVDTSSAKDESNYTLNNGIGNPSLSEILVDDSTIVQLQFASNFTNETYYDLTIQNVADRNLDSLQSVVTPFLYFVPEQFDVVINEIMADPTPSVNLPEYEYIEIYNTSDFDISVAGWTIQDASSTLKDLPSEIIKSNEFYLLCSNTAESELNSYGNVLIVSGFPTFNDGEDSVILKDETGNVISSVAYTSDWYNDADKEDGGWSIEKIDPLNNCSGINNWKASVDENGGTPGQQNSVFTSNIDNEEPVLEKLEIVSNNQLKLIFNEPLVSSSENSLNYSVNNGIGNPSTVVLNDLKEVSIIFDNSFVDGSNYTITIENIEDKCGNAISSVDKDFTYYDTKPFDIVINEIFADPEPIIGLPEYEYVEIYNTTDYEIDLSGWKLKIGTSERDFPDSTIISTGYNILCSAIASEFLDDFGTITVFTSFPLISNSGTSVVIFNKNDQVIDSINFTTDWYNDAEKEDGGWSIEKIDPLNNCSGITNWKASEDEDGGTPGQQNSVFASNIDNEAPQIIKVEILTENQLKITFDEPVTEETIIDKANYQIDNGVGNPFSVVASSDLREVDLLFLNSFPQEVNLTLSLENLEDYCGNISSLVTNDFIYYVPQPYDVVINEIMANPDPPIGLPEVEYIELYNITDYDILLKDWILFVGSTQKYFADDTIKSQEYLILCDDDMENLFADYGRTSTFSSLSLTDGGQTLVLRDKEEKIITQVSYTEDWYQDDFKAEGGWSLEQIDPLNPCGEENNWIASESETGGTPGDQNSVKAENPDLDAPILLRIAVIDDQTVELFFNESIDSLSAMQTNIFTVDNGIGNPVTIRFDGVEYKSVMLYFANYFENNTMYTLEISGGLIDCAGNEIAGGSAAKFSTPLTPEENDIVINEILFNPLPDGVDFVEIYNRSEKTIDLADLLIASYDDEETDFASIERITEDGYLIFPREYLVLTEDPEQTKQDYLTENPDGFLLVDNLPGYNDDQGRVMLLDEQQNIIDNVGYIEDMHFALLATNEGVSLERINFNRPSDDETNWHSASELVGFATPAYENSQFKESEDVSDVVKIDPEIFSPDNDGFEDFANISFTFNEPGYVTNIKIFDSRGRLIRYLANNQLLGIEGTISWDGLDENNQKAPVGIYVVFIEIFDLEGNVKQYKKSVVVAARY